MRLKYKFSEKEKDICSIWYDEYCLHLFLLISLILDILEKIVIHKCCILAEGH